MGDRKRTENDSGKARPEDESQKTRPTRAHESVREGYERASPPEKQGDGDPSPLDVTES